MPGGDRLGPQRGSDRLYPAERPAPRYEVSPLVPALGPSVGPGGCRAPGPQTEVSSFFRTSELSIAQQEGMVPWCWGSENDIGRERHRTGRKVLALGGGITWSRALLRRLHRIGRNVLPPTRWGSGKSNILAKWKAPCRDLLVRSILRKYLPWIAACAGLPTAPLHSANM